MLTLFSKVSNPSEEIDEEIKKLELKFCEVLYDTDSGDYIVEMRTAGYTDKEKAKKDFIKLIQNLEALNTKRAKILVDMPRTIM